MKYIQNSLFWTFHETAESLQELKRKRFSKSLMTYQHRCSKRIFKSMGEDLNLLIIMTTCVYP